ncbi:carbohydrate kinase family protein [Candidatus Bathyarchaeota archaeon]|nr:MAG: ribokinase [Candidatus Bathyarchaeota archaeon ex4484_40]RJS80214.1 MAG: carbohydrate kinase family protein [Candidatus Bathyarchaeota archaeon]HDJ04951.1 carbohydrate kinase family protein [Candidatus Bathyarchaeota archaeon]
MRLAKHGDEGSGRFEVVCFGALNVDRLYKVNRIAGADEESYITGFTECPGGSAANTAVGLARLGVKTGYIGKVAKDREGTLLLEAFRCEGVDTGGVVISERGRSGVVMGYVDTEGGRALYVDPGVNDLLDPEEVKVEYAAGAEFLHLTSFIGDRPFEAQKRLVEALPDVKVTLDPGALYARRGFEALKPIVKRCYALLLNEAELRLLTGIEGYVEGAKFLIDEGVDVVAVKLGGRGCYVTDGTEEHFIKPYIVDVVDTTGAGDAFNAGFLYGLVRNKTLKMCGLLGNYTASRCIMKAGARNGLPRLRELPSRFR